MHYSLLVSVHDIVILGILVELVLLVVGLPIVLNVHKGRMQIDPTFLSLSFLDQDDLFDGLDYVELNDILPELSSLYLGII